MEKLDHAPKNKGDESESLRFLRLISPVLERHLIAWFFVGIAVVYFAEGYLLVSSSLGAVGFFTPSSITVRYFLRFIGFSVSILAVFHAFSKVIRHKRAFGVCTFASWMILIFLLSSHYISVSSLYPGPEDYRYDLIAKQFKIDLPEKVWRAYEGERLVFLVRKRTSSTVETDTNVVIESFPAQAPHLHGHVAIPLNDTLTRNLRLGDTIECYVLATDPARPISEARCLKDLRMLNPDFVYPDALSNEVVIDGEASLEIGLELLGYTKEAIRTLLASKPK